LIGGSFALALKRARAVKLVVGVGRTRANLTAALDLGVIDEATQDPAIAVEGADFVLLAMPVGQMPAVMRRIAPHLAPETVVTDAGSTKRDVIAYARRHLAARLAGSFPPIRSRGRRRAGPRRRFPTCTGAVTSSSRRSRRLRLQR
jgi:prephenate dehydrogenase